VLFALFIISSLTFLHSQIQLSDWEISEGNTITAENEFAYFQFNVSAGNTLANFTIWPCYGGSNLFIRSSAFPTDKIYNAGSIYSPGSLISESYAQFQVGSGTPVYAGVQAATNGTGTTQDYAVKFDIVATSILSNASNGYSARVPQTLNAQISFEKDISDDTATITFATTGNPLDSYLYYRYNSTLNFNTDGYVTGTACGVREFMEVAYPVTVTTSGNTIIATFTVEYQMTGFTQNSFIIIASRNCTSLGYECYENVYLRVDVSEGRMLRGLGWGMLMLAVLSLLFG